MLDSHGEGDDDDEDTSMDVDEEIFEDTEGVDLEQLMREAAQFRPRQIDNNDSINSLEGLQLQLQEKEQALELSAKIGQTLVLKTNHLATKIKALEQQVEARGDQVHQLEYEKQKLEKELRRRLYVDEDENEDTVNTSVLMRQPSCCSCCEDNAEALRSQIKRLEDENFQKSSELSRLSAQLESERVSAREDLNECWRRLDLVESDKCLLLGKLEAKCRKIELLQEELIGSKNEVNCLAALLVKAEVELEGRLDAFVRERDSLQAKYDEATDRCEEYIALYNELKSLNAALEQRLRRRSRGEIVPHRQRRLSMAEELDMTENMPSPMGVVRCGGRSVSGSPSSCVSPTKGHVTRYWTCPEEAELLQARLFPADESFRDRIRSVLGQPGRPGSHDLDVSLLRLSVLSGQGKVLVGYTDSHSLQNGLYQRALQNEHLTRENGRRSVDSGYNGPRTGGMKFTKFRSGSWILHCWRQLSTPHLGNLLEVHEGVIVRYNVDLTATRSRPDHGGCVCQRRPLCSTPSLEDLKEDATSTYNDDFDGSSIASGAYSDIEDD